jgi:hypothetical protein
MAPQPTRLRFRLKASTVAIIRENGKEEMFHLSGEEITVLNRLDESNALNRLVEIEWNGQRVKMFAIDCFGLWRKNLIA